MADLSAHFTADFSNFKTAVDNATTKLKDFQSDANKVQASLNRVGDSFSGRRLIQDATLATKAINEIGGASNLTAKEQARLNAQVTEAIAKYHALGQEAPKDLVAIEKATRQNSSAIVSFGKDVAGIAAGFLTAQAAISGLQSVIRGIEAEFKFFTVQGAAVGDVTENFDHLTESAGRLGSTLLTSLRTGTHGTISDFNLIKLASQDLTAGLELTDAQFGILAKGAFALAQATGTDVATGLETMNDAMLTGRTRTLALLTGKIDLQQAEEKYARSLGTTRDKLSDEGKLEAARAAILDSVTAATNRLGEQTDGLDEKVAQASAAFENFQNQLGRTVANSPVILAALDGIGEALRTAFGENEGDIVRGIARRIDEAALALVEFAKVGVQSAGFIYKEFLALNKLIGDTAQIVDGVRLALLGAQRAAVAAQGDFKSFGILTTQIDSLIDTMAARGKALQDEGAAQGKVDATTAAYLKTLDELIVRMKAARGATDEHTAATGRSADGLARHAGLIKEDASALKAYADALASIGQTLTPLAPVQEQTIRLLHEFGVGTDTIAKSLKLTTDQVSLFIASLDNFTAVVDDVSNVAIKLEEAFDKVFDTENLEAFKAEIDSIALHFENLSDEFGAIDIGADNLKAFRDEQAAIALGFEDIAQEAERSFHGRLLSNLQDLRKSVPKIITDAFTGGGGLSGALKGIGVQLANAFLEPFIDTIIKGLAQGSLKRAFGNALSGAVAGTAIGGAAAGAGSVAAQVGGVESAIIGGGGGAGASLAAFATNPITIGVAAAIGGALVLRHFLSGGKQANDIRDQFQAQFGGPGTGSGSGFRRLADLEHRVGSDALFAQLQSANNPGAVRAAEAAIISDLSRHNLNKGIKSYDQGGFVPPGVVQPAILHGGRFGERIISGNRQTQGPALNQTSVIINVSAVDAAGFDRVWKERIVQQLKLELLTNQLGIVTAINRVVAKA